MARGGHNSRGGGGRGKGRGRGGGGRGGRGGGQRNFQPDNRVSFQNIDKRNEKFERYYNTIGLLPDETERAAFWAALRTELPNSFRFTGSKGHALSVRENLVTRFFPMIKEITHEGRPVELPTAMPWYPEGLAYSMTTPKNVVRKYGPFKEFQRFLVSETGVGNISRQEQVSMIPPLLLDVQPHHSVLDLCAAPGSKSAQLIELIHAGEEDRVKQAIERAKTGAPAANGNPDLGEDSGRATGMLVANDVNYRRAQMLVHQVKRLNSPNMIVMNHDATMFPSIELPAGSQGLNKQGKYLKFDRILADVPCSGDGTCRKNPNIWKDWTPQNGLGLYTTQVRILVRALQMLKVGGRVVYSTCSLNPMENEAVVSSAIERCGGVAKVKLLDCADQLPGLLRKPGLRDWSIMSRGGQIYESWAEAVQFEGEDSKVVPGMFPPEVEEEIPLEHCMRVYPHQQDTGGFFITALEKLGDIRAKPEPESKSGNKNWTFTKPEPQSTAFTELLEDIASGKAEEPRTVPELPNSDASAAQRSNEPAEPLETSTTKRSAVDEPNDELPVKKAKLADDISEASLEANATRREHWPLPPAVTDAVEASGNVPGAGIVGDSDDTIASQGADDVGAATAQPVPPEIAQATVTRRKRGDESVQEEAFKFLSATHPDLESIYKFYELHSSFPRDRFLVRNPAGDPVKGIYYSSQLVKDILTTNEKRGMKFVHAGVKMFMKQDAQGQDICRWRIQTEGLPIIEGWVGDSRVVRMSKRRTLRKLLVEMFPKISTYKDEDGNETGGWKDLNEIGEQVRDIGMGCCVLRADLAPEDSEDGFREHITLPLWRSMYSLNLMLPKEDRRAMLLRLFNEEPPLINHSDPKQTGYEAASKGGEAVEKDAAAEKEELNADDDDDVDADAMSLEQDIIAIEDKTQAARLEVLEDEDRKTSEAMPERQGEGDHYNKTI
ncbi:S-adenosyl-L-methionine-dependent methyltransferase [Dissoconium aciculare CBS 342.82]|uniref:S-adenosyl-L-methionine-dependent methyltransferase n=1 Tax=Dissoconium aciculare CBS 342.82 TaxID=1314786 RepID=A0A6J3MBH6_9PEZI|nr:S-adenosyl-L-methionine-dependent methyltransferase [Dissoconium aciculare CBS 342.82]KAF1825360.1 S-adenosyl-L-methionine-dependent methyltransferase [Dissoconium aciculare CBS 342.82]